MKILWFYPFILIFLLNGKLHVIILGMIIFYVRTQNIQGKTVYLLLVI